MAEASPPASLEDWEFPGWGTVRRLKDLDTKGVQVKRLDQPKHLARALALDRDLR